MRRLVLIGAAAGMSGSAGAQTCDPPFAEHAVGRALGTPTAPVADLDGDGDLDIVTPMYDIPLQWFENLGGRPLVFAAHSVWPGPCSNYSWHVRADTVDLEADGDIDIFCVPLQASGDLVWFENLGGSPPEFCEHDVGQFGYATGNGGHAADVDGDGDLDLIGTVHIPGQGDALAWYESDGGTPPQFTDHLVAGPDASWWVVWGGDLDGDGDGDVIAGSDRYSEPRVAWFENQGGTPPTFMERTIMAMPHTVWGVGGGDLDGDGDLDALSWAYGESVVRWFENVGGTPTQFVARILGDAAATYMYTISPVDFDRDGRLDVLTPGPSLYLNQGGSPPEFVRCTPGPGAYAATAGDIDLDGSTDIVVRVGHDVLWLENPRCVADFNDDGVVDTRDFLAFLNAWNANDPGSDINADGSIDTLDVLAFLNLWNRGCE